VDEAIPEVNHARSGVEHLNRSATVQSTEILGTTLSATWWRVSNAGSLLSPSDSSQAISCA